MCKAFDDLLKEERQEGRREGRREGKLQGKREGKKQEKYQTIMRMIKGGCDEAFIRRMTHCTKEEFAKAAGR